jgi:hypothetical protein
LDEVFGSKEKKKGPAPPPPSTMRALPSERAEVIDDGDRNPSRNSKREESAGGGASSAPARARAAGGSLLGKRAHEDGGDGAGANKSPKVLESLPRPGDSNLTKRKKRLSWKDGLVMILFLSCRVLGCTGMVVRVLCVVVCWLCVFCGRKSKANTPARPIEVSSLE